MRTVVSLLLLAASLAATSAASRAADDQTLRLAVSALPAQVGNPYRYTGYPALYITAAMFDALTRVGADGTPEPALAVSWERVSDLVWRFHLRKGVTFSNGRPFDAEAVVKTVAYVTSSQASVESIHANMADLRGARAVDAHTVEITTAKPDLFFPRVISELNIVEPTQWAKGRDAFALEPVGTGPFAVTAWAANAVKLKAVPTSWRAPLLQALEIQAIPDAVIRVQALLSGQTDVALLLGPESVEPVQSAGRRMMIYPTGGVLGIAFVTEKAQTPVRDVRVRQALNYAVDKTAITRALLGEHARAASQIAPRVAFGFDPDLAPYPHDPARARALLAEAGHTRGLKVTMEAVPGTVAADAAIFQQVALDLAQVGVNLQVRATTFQAYSRHYVQGDWEGDAFGILYATDPYLDALKPLKRHSCLWVKPWYCDRTGSALAEQAFTAATLDERQRLTREVMRRYHTEAAAIFLTEVSGYAGLSPRVRDLEIINTVLRLEKTRLEPIP